MPCRKKNCLRAGLAMAALGAIGTALADPNPSVSGLPIPRYVSLKSDRVNLREGPSKDHRTIWIFQRAGLPVEITAEFEIWRKRSEERRVGKEWRYRWSLLYYD